MTLRQTAGVLAGLALAAPGCARSAPPPEPVTFNKHIAPIVFAHCAPCHRPGGAAPFSLLRFADAVSNADEIALRTRTRRMPPWQPEPGEFRIHGERRLTDAQIDMIQRWVAEGAPEGSQADLPRAPSFPEGWQLGRPDAILTLPGPYVVPPGTEDVYRNLVFRTSLAPGAFVRAVEFDPRGAPVHHAVIRVDRSSASRRRDGSDGQPGYDGMAWHTVHDPDGHFLGWAPGRGPIVSPDGMPWRLERGADVVVELHVIPGKEPISLQPQIGLYFTPAPPARSPITERMGSKAIDIPPGHRDYVVTDTYELPVAVELLSVYPHAHYLATDMRVTAAFPDGRESLLLHIRDWSFHWQQDYRFVTPIALPRGTRLTMRYTYDNSADNPDNPSDPPVRVRAGPKSTDEMAELGLQLLPRSAADAGVIARAFAERELVANAAAVEARVREEPRVAEYRALLGGTYVEMGRHADAIPHLETAIRLDPRSVAAHSYLGVALFEQRRLDAALRAFRRAAALDARDERLPFNIGNVLSALGRPADAVAAYRRSLAISPDFVDAHVNLAVAEFSRGRVAAALEHYARALALAPDSAVIHSNLGGALAAAGRYEEAMRHVRRALELEPGYPPALDNLRRLQGLGVRTP